MTKPIVNSSVGLVEVILQGGGGGGGGVCVCGGTVWHRHVNTFVLSVNSFLLLPLLQDHLLDFFEMSGMFPW